MVCVCGLALFATYIAQSDEIDWKYEAESDRNGNQKRIVKIEQKKATTKKNAKFIEHAEWEEKNRLLAI